MTKRDAPAWSFAREKVAAHREFCLQSSKQKTTELVVTQRSLVSVFKLEYTRLAIYIAFPILPPNILTVLLRTNMTA